MLVANRISAAAESIVRSINASSALQAALSARDTARSSPGHRRLIPTAPNQLLQLRAGGQQRTWSRPCPILRFHRTLSDSVQWEMRQLVPPGASRFIFAARQRPFRNLTQDDSWMPDYYVTMSLNSSIGRVLFELPGDFRSQWQ